MNENLQKVNEKDKSLFLDIKNIIDSAKKDFAVQVNSTMSALYWEIGNRINKDLLKEKRAEYGKQIVSQLAKQLQTEYGSNSFSDKNLRRMMQFASVFPDRKIVVSLRRQFSWSHSIAFIPIQDELKRSFYMEMSHNSKMSATLGIPQKNFCFSNFLFSTSTHHYKSL